MTATVSTWCNSRCGLLKTSFLEIINGRCIALGDSRGFCIRKTMGNRTNPRHANGNLRRKHRARLKAMAGPCGICQGRLGPIHYDEPSDAAHPLSFVIDEIHPVSKWRLFGYDSPEAAAQDWSNLQAAHYICNAKKSNRLPDDGSTTDLRAKVNMIDGDW